MMGVHDRRASRGREHAWRKWLGRVASQPADSAQGAPAQTARLDLPMSMTTEGDQLRFDVASEGACQLERVALAAAE
jgi:hypothetical protein